MLSTLQRSVFLLTALSALLVLPSDGLAKKRKNDKKGKAASACGLDYLPFSEGHSYTYAFVFPPDVDESTSAVKAKAPETFGFKVMSVSEGKSGTEIQLEERYVFKLGERDQEVKYNTTLVCTDDKLEVPPTSFFFAGELGTLGMELQNVKTKGETFPGKAGLVRGDAKYMELKADVLRKPAGGAKIEHSAAKLEIERQITIGKKAEVEVDYGTFDATEVEVAMSGRTALAETADKQVSLPEGTATMWFVPNVGLVRVYNRMGQGWALSTRSDAEGKAIEP